MTMNFSDINFSRINEMLNNLSENEKEQIDAMANNMLNQMREQNTSQEEEETDFKEGLHLSEEYEKLDGGVLDALEQAWDLEDFYDGQMSDYSGSVLFLQKALLKELRTKTENARSKSLGELAAMEKWKPWQPVLMQVATFLQKAEYDEISYEELQAIKEIILPLLLEIDQA